MRRLEMILALVMVVQIAQGSRHHSYERVREMKRYHISCVQEEPDCEKCLFANKDCQWCSDASLQRGQCHGGPTCPHGLSKKSTCKQQVEGKGAKRAPNYYDKTLDELEAMGAPVLNNSEINDIVVAVNASVLCGNQSGCDNCTASDSCLWCAAKQECQVFLNLTETASSCPEENNAFHNQCLYPIGVIPCADRNNCSDCLRRDDICYWCSSNESCAYYQGQLKCPKNNRYYDECPVAGSLFWVLFPILAIILIPVIIYLIIWLICCCMRAAGYDPLEPTEPSAKKRPKGIRLKPGSPTNKTDELRKKYDLNDP